MSSNKLGEFYIELGTQGEKKVKSELDAVKAKMDSVAGAGGAGGLSGIVGKIGTAVASAAAAVAKAGAGLVATFTGLATAGLRGTVEGNRLSFAWEQFTREIAGITMPVIEGLTGMLQKLTNWLSKLSGSGQDLILKVASWVAILAGGALILSGNVLAGGALVATGAAGLAFGGKGGAHRRPREESHGFEAITDTYKRIQMAVSKVGGGENIPKDQLQELKKANETLNESVTELRGLRGLGGAGA